MPTSARSVWKGFIQVSLVSVPVRAYNAADTAEAGVTFHQLHVDCHSRVKYRKTCPIHGELRDDEIVKGFQYAKDQYVVIDPAEVSKLRRQSDRAISIQGFIDPADVDLRFHEGRTQYLAPDGAPAFKPYVLLQRAMAEAGHVAFAKVIVAGRERLVLLRPIDGLLAMTFLSYAQELKPIEPFLHEAPSVPLDAAEAGMAVQLAEAMAIDDFDLSAYHDDYNERLRKLIEAKVSGQEIITPPAAESPTLAIGNLMEALRNSLAQSKARQQPARAAGKPSKLAAPSAGDAEAKRQRRRKSS